MIQFHCAIEAYHLYSIIRYKYFWTESVEYEMASRDLMESRKFKS